MAYFDGLQWAQFGGIHFPVTEITLSSQQRHHLHEYPHTPGSALEKLGRKSYTIRVSPIFDEDIRKYDQINGIRLYPDALERLQFLFEEETTAALTIPTLGTIDAFMITFSRRMDAMVRSGEKADMEFVEDQSSVFLVEQTMRVVQDLPAAVTLLQFLPVKVRPEEKTLLEEILAAVNATFALVDSGERFINKIAAKVDMVSQLIQRAEQKIAWLQHPENWRVVEALKELDASARSLVTTAAMENGPRVFVVPTRMTLQQISQSIYKTTERSLDVLRMNDIEDDLRVPAGSKIRYFP